MHLILQSKSFFSEAISWDGDNIDQLSNFCGQGNLTWSEAESVTDVQVWNKHLHRHLPVPLRFFVVKGVEGELYVIKESVLSTQFNGSPA